MDEVLDEVRSLADAGRPGGRVPRADGQRLSRRARDARWPTCCAATAADRRDRADPLHDLAPGADDRRADGRDGGRAARGLSLPAPAGAVGKQRGAARDAPRLRPRRLPGARSRVCAGAFPGSRFGTDVIVGFPGGDRARSSSETLACCDEVEFDTVYSFAYSARPGTAAAGAGRPVPDAVKLERLQRLQALPEGDPGSAATGAGSAATVEVLVEGPSKRDPSRWTGRTPGEPDRQLRGRAGRPAGSSAVRDHGRDGVFAAGRDRVRRPTSRDRVDRRRERIYIAASRLRGRRTQGMGRMAVEMKIKGLMIDPVSNMPIIILKNADGDAVLPIWVGIFEANAIAMQLEKIVSPRPMTHDLLKNVIEGLRGRASSAS